MAQAQAKPLPFRRVLLPLAVLATLLGWGPIAAVLAAAGIIRITGCELSGAGPRACVVLGVDIGDTLYQMSMSVWLLMLTFPLAILAVPMWVLLIILHLRARSAPTPTVP